MDDKNLLIDNIDIIKIRKSVRNYKEELLPKEVIDKLDSYINKVSNPFNEKVTIKLIEGEQDQKLGTYGVIKGAKMYLGAVCENGDFDLEALGYEFEKVVLFATKLGIGTCWLGGTFNKGNFAKVMEVKSNEKFPIVSPIGYSSDSKRLIDSIAKFTAKSGQRKKFKEIFFKDDFNNLLSEDDSNKYLNPLEMVRIAPSAVNGQPWRIVYRENRLDFYKTKPSRDMNRIDMGIALAHFHISCNIEGIEGMYKKVSKNEIIDNDSYEYVISWIEK